MTAKESLYEVLGLSRDATADDIKKAYKKAALKYHPDKNTDDPQTAEEQFKKVTEAYTILSDPEKRTMYDQFGTVDDGGMPNMSAMHTNMEDILKMKIEYPLQRAALTSLTASPS